MSASPQSPAVPSLCYLGSQDIQHLCDTTDDLRWYAVFTFSRHEKRVFTQCEERQIESFLPTYKAEHRWKNRCRVVVELPLFPSYSFVRIDPRMRAKVLQLPGVISIVSSGRHLLPLPDEYMNSLRNGLLVHKMEPHPGLAIGCRVRIRKGPMAGAIGILERDKSNLRVILRLEMLSRSVSVEVGSSEIEPCESRIPALDLIPGALA
jgi:transcription antitermination factor NusG